MHTVRGSRPICSDATILGILCAVTKPTGIMGFLVGFQNAILTRQSTELLTEKVIILYQRIKANTRSEAVSSKCGRQKT